jgi:Domain of unknown function (DUF4928)
MSIEARLEAFKTSSGFATKGKLAVALLLTRRAIESGLPLDEGALLAKGGAQVAGLSGRAVDRILADHGVGRSLGTEVGRTSRGTPQAARLYCAWLNSQSLRGAADLRAVEQWWAARVKDLLAAKPFALSFDQSRTLRAALGSILDQARQRQRDAQGMMLTGTVLQHLVGAKLSLALPNLKVEHHGASVADGASARHGDFDVGDVAIHCTTAPTEALLAKCAGNIDMDIRPLILTLDRGVAVAEGLAEQAGLAERVEVMDALQFLAANLYEMSLFRASERRPAVQRLLDRYNEIIDGVETDHSLKVQVG